uniref:Acetylcholinesterase n=1 Tax=Strongyloides stercoralis TaxID=6248 RepID=A0A0K0EM55_STRER
MKIFLFLIPLITQLSCTSLVVETKHGKIKGVPSLVAKDVVEFLGVPYALPPLKELRFREPQCLPKKYYYNFKAMKYAKACIQVPRSVKFKGLDEWYPNKKEMSEDCLQLNMWVPKNKTGAVMVFLFGGQYTHGSPSLKFYDGNILARKTGTIVITLNYRLGVFGFAYYKADKKDGIPGNLGLLDQQLGLKWIQENIASFGGDPEKVTLFGQGTGSAMATAHLFSENSTHLFKRIIASSGTVFNRWSYSKSEHVEENFETLIKKVKCDCNSLKKEVSCMQTLDPFYLSQQASSIQNPKQFITVAPFLPVNDEEVFFMNNVDILLKKKVFTKEKVELLIGKTADEGSLFMPLMLNDKKFGCKFDFKSIKNKKKNQCLMNMEQYEKVINLIQQDHRLTDEGKNEIIKLYNNKTLYKEYRDKALRAISDFGFDCSINEFAEYIKEHFDHKVHYYIFKKRSNCNPWPKWMGAMHRYDLLYIFGYPFIKANYYKKCNQKDEKAYSEKIMNVFAAFALKGDVTKEVEDLEKTFKKNKDFKDKFEIGHWNHHSFGRKDVCYKVRYIEKHFKHPKQVEEEYYYNYDDIYI